MSLPLSRVSMLIVCLFNFLALSSAQQPRGYPQQVDKYVNDFACVINPEHVKHIRENLEIVKRQTGIEVCIATINSVKDFPDTTNGFEEFATALINRWNIGSTTIKNAHRGILLLVAIKDRAVRIELGLGYAANPYNAKAQKIIDDVMLPQFRASNYSLGINEGITAMIDNIVYKKDEAIPLVVIIFWILTITTCVIYVFHHRRLFFASYYTQGSFRPFGHYRSPSSRGSSGRGASGRW